MSLSTAPVTIQDVLQGFREEIKRYYQLMELFKTRMDLQGILNDLSGISARASSIRNEVIRSKNQQVKEFRIGEVDPLISEVERQFKIWSRIGSVAEMEWKMGGGTT